jgi:hypothetical protein
LTLAKRKGGQEEGERDGGGEKKREMRGEWERQRDEGRRGGEREREEGGEGGEGEGGGTEGRRKVNVQV